jgi:hypothetical protein
MTTRTLLLAVDATVVVYVVDPVLEYAAYKGGGDDVSTTVPDGAREWEVTDPRGRARAAFVRPEVLAALRDSAQAGVDIVWNSSWLTAPERPRALARDLELDGIVRFPTPTELRSTPTDEPFHRASAGFWNHWKMQNLVELVRTLPPGHDLVLADSGVDLSALSVAETVRKRAGNPAASLGSIPTSRTRGLDEGALRGWMPERARPSVWHHDSDLG